MFPFCLHVFRHDDGFFQRSQFAVDLLQLIFVVALGNHTATRLEPKFSVSADERANGDGLVEVPVEPDESDATTIGATVVWLHFTDELHCTDFRRSAQSTGRKCVNECLDRICTIFQLSADATHKVNDMAVVLHIFVEVHFDVVTVAAEVVSCQIDEHDVFGILFGVVAKEDGVFLVLLLVACAFCCAGNRIDICPPVFDAAVCFRG